MSTESDKLWLRIFLVGLAVVAFVINAVVSSLFSPSSRPLPQARAGYQPAAQPTQPVMATTPFHSERQGAVENVSVSRSPAEDAAVKRANYIARYLNSGFARNEGAKMVAVAIVAEDGSFNPTLNAAVAAHFQTNSAQVLSSLFRPAFVTDGLLTQAIAGSTTLFDKLGLSSSLDLLVLGREVVQYSSDPSLENVITAKMRLEVTARFLATGESQTWTFGASGAGFKRPEARSMGEERLLKQISKDTKMSLNL